MKADMPDDTTTGPGYKPIRNPDCKWYMDPDLFPDPSLPVGTQYAVGWAYLMSRDTVQTALRVAAGWELQPHRAPVWWGVLPWEDVMVGALLREAGWQQTSGLPQPGASGSVSNAFAEFRVWDHKGFRQPYASCGPNTVAKHLDLDAPALLRPLFEAEMQGVWGDADDDEDSGDGVIGSVARGDEAGGANAEGGESRGRRPGSVICSTGSFQPGDAAAWRTWRNSQAESRLTGTV
ncbi:hypothetical protein V8C86DRAFT_1400075 [Haematococcus lacustris]